MYLLVSSFNPYSSGFSIYFTIKARINNIKAGFNPYSSGFSIYLYVEDRFVLMGKRLQSLFIWIFYLFKDTHIRTDGILNASILIHLDFLSILIMKLLLIVVPYSFNPYSSGFSIYFNSIISVLRN